MDRRSFLKTSGAAAMCASMMQKPAEANPLADKPNLLFIFPDQYRRYSMGFWNKPAYQGALNCVSDPVITPNIDKLADEGIVFTQAVSTCPVCSPYRGMLMSGMFPESNGLHLNCNTGRTNELDHDAVCVTDVLHQQGYETSYFGKTHWHRTEALFDSSGNYVGTTDPPGGYYTNNYDTYIPEGKSRHSVQYWHQVLRDSHNDPYVYGNDPVPLGGKTDGQRYRPREFSTKHEADVIVDYLNNTRQQRDTTKPFCLFWAPNPPHSPYSSMGDVEPDVYNTYYASKSPSSLLNRPNVEGTSGSGNVRYYDSNVTSVDIHVGRVLDALEAQGLKDNTIVVFTADHGEMMGSHGTKGKSKIYEEAFGVPFIVRYPAALKHRIESTMIGPTDVMPTLLSLMGFKSEIPAAVEGIDYAPLLVDENTSEVSRPKSALYIGVGDGSRGVRTDKYSLWLRADGSVRALHNNVTDPYQMTNLSLSSIPSADKQELLEELGSWLAKSNDMWFQRKLNSNLVVYPSSTATKHKPNTQPARLQLKPGYPNPFTSATNIQLVMPEASSAKVTIRNVFGRRVRTLHSGHLKAGEHRMRWDGCDDRGKRVASGVYQCVLRARRRVFRQQVRMIG